MTMRNVGIVFSPTLGIPAGVFSLMLGEFNRVFNVDADTDGAHNQTGEHSNDDTSELHPRNSRQYSDAAADQLLGLTGRSLKGSYHVDCSEDFTYLVKSAPTEESPSDGDDSSMQEESGTETTEGDFTIESSSDYNPASVSQQVEPLRMSPPGTPTVSKMSKASIAAATRGLNVSVTSTRQSRVIGIPSSPRLPQSPARPPASSPTISRNDRS